MKKAAAIFLLSIFLFNTMGYFIAFKISQLQIKEAIREDIENGILHNSVSTLVIENSKMASLNWLEDDEFEYNNERYDVLHKSSNGGSTTLYCINDSKESVLFSNMDEHVKNHVTPVKSTKDAAAKTIADNVVKIVKHHSYSIDAAALTLNSNSFPPFFSNYTFALIEANFQPPELA
ncbi:MAG: hypothetical protein JWO44_419 [Bacteroidetes bacterium]|nr:hypothetical protein [Bacteroidota bacterium]